MKIDSFYSQELNGFDKRMAARFASILLIALLLIGTVIGGTTHFWLEELEMSDLRTMARITGQFYEHMETHHQDPNLELAELLKRTPRISGISIYTDSGTPQIQLGTITPDMPSTTASIVLGDGKTGHIEVALSDDVSMHVFVRELSLLVVAFLATAVIGLISVRRTSHALGLPVIQMADWFTRILEWSPAYILAADADGKVLFSSASYRQAVTAMAPAPAPASPPDVFAPPEIRAALTRTVAASDVKEIHVVLQDGTLGRELLFTSFPFKNTPDSMFEAGCMIGIDITATKKLQQELLEVNQELQKSARNAEELAQLYAEQRSFAEAANHAKTLFIANMSHELRTPLNAIIGFSQLIMEQPYEPIAARYRDYASDINNSGQHLLQLINTILDVSRIELGEHDIKLAQTDIRPCIADCHRMLMTQATKRQVQLVYQEPPSPLYAVADERGIKQIAVNLIGNAIKFTKPGGKIEISSRIDGTDACLTVKDTGIGMTLQEIERAFDPFWQADASFSRRNDGLGLGLAIVQRLTKLMSGTVTIDSIKGEGTEVTVRLPTGQK